ncbi:hypothetical protein SAMN02745225_01930 [Ferrithrix thermotolerans DSM 19514]|uniref:Uncharacterized protein n=1 Tax=Ferrithrix thermotolerans DSM 19514 TaxID=1121881 RepID=A0A1M4X894_9ACTN|nr:pilus assembly PilX N-terminal domain-containing protein [Ferrithrix thermotolerans]SHE89615.1 hypothetical protein SAMN02745225_01930 [Ferrithrix thermotolerans DSM 19514]
METKITTVKKYLRYLFRDAQGDAVVLVVLAIMLMTLIPVALFTTSVAQLPIAQGEQEYQRALAAAEAGVSDYINRLNQSSLSQSGNYWQYSATNLPPDGNPAFTGWATVPHSNGEYFHYTPNTSQTASTGVVYLTSTGLSLHGSTPTYRTITVGIRPDGFLNYLTLTDKNVIDPYFAPYVSYLSQTQAQNDCAYRYDQYNPSIGSDGPNMSLCSSLLAYYATGSTATGSLFSNDIYYMNGTPKFDGRVYSASTRVSGASSHPYWIDPLCGTTCSGDSPSFQNSSDPSLHPSLAFPTLNTALESAAQQDGCIYVGPTYIHIEGSYMTVKSPETPTTGFTNPNCLGSGTLPLPANGVIYVENMSSPLSCSGTVTIQGESLPCGEGDALTQGRIQGQLTIGSANDIFITGDLEYQGCASGGTTDVLGLVSNNFTELSSGFSSSNVTSDSCLGQSITTPVIYAAILALNHSFDVQNFWSIPPSGNLYIFGSISEEYADLEGSFNQTGLTNGYNTIYTYDQRLAYLTPPYFLSPLNAAWLQMSFSEVANPNTLPPLP